MTRYCHTRPCRPVRRRLLAAALWIVLLLAALTAAPSPAPAQGINAGWKFLRVDGSEPPALEAPTADDARWETVVLPHTPRLEKYDATHPWQGVCWYRKTLLPDPVWNGQRVSLRFGAAMQTADVWVNGVHKTRHLGGYLPFMVDLTGEAGAAKPIVIAAHLDNRDTDQVPPGKPTNDLDFNYPGGLYRGISLVITDPVHVSDPVEANLIAGGGVFVTYSDVSEESATLHIKTDVADDSEAIAPKCTVRSTLTDMAGRFVQAVTSDPVMISAGGHHAFVQTLVVDSPRLWHPDHPALYTLITTVSRAGQPTDEVRTHLGIRTFALGRGGLHINGKPFRIHGSNRHQEYPYLEYALSPNAGRRDAQHIKDGGFNHIRLSHYPQDPAFLDACDALGILVQAPIPGWQIFHANPSFVTRTFQDIRDLIRRDRNHPCVVFWEPNLNETSPPTDWCEAAYETAHQEYPGDQCLTFGDPYPGGWHGWDVKNFAREYGDFGFGGNESTSRQTRGLGESAMLQQTWNFLWSLNGMDAAFENPQNTFIGSATWCMFDYNRGYYPKQEWSGMMDIFRLPKYVYRFYQSQRDPNQTRPDAESGPMVFIANDWTLRPSPSRVVVFSNCAEVALLVNGKLFKRQRPDAGPDTPYSKKKVDLADTNGTRYDDSGGYMFDGGNAKHLAHPPFTFSAVPYAPGTLKALGYLGGKHVASDAVRTPEVPKSLILAFDTVRSPLVADGADAVFVRASVADRNGTVVPLNALPSLTFSVTGPARLVGIDPVHVEVGVASVLLQAGLEPGMIQVTARAEGLAPVTATITSQPAENVTPRAPGILPVPLGRPVPTRFTKLTGTVLGTPGAYSAGVTDIAKAFDGNTSTFVDAAEATAGNDCWLGLDLGTPKTITKIRFFPRLSWTRRMAGGKFQGSDTPDFHANVKDLTAPLPEPTNGQWTEITDIASAHAYRYVRYLSPDDGWNNVAEIEFYTSA